MRWKILPILAVVIAMLVAGCAPKISKPEAEVSTVTLKNIGLTSTDVNVKVKVTNNNPIGANLNKITYDLYFKKEGEWNYLGKGKKTEKVHIRKQGQTTIGIPTTINNVSVLESLVPLARKGSVDIKVDGSVFLDLKATSYEIPFKKITTIETERRTLTPKPQKSEPILTVLDEGIKSGVVGLDSFSGKLNLVVKNGSDREVEISRCEFQAGGKTFDVSGFHLIGAGKEKKVTYPIYEIPRSPGAKEITINYKLYGGYDLSLGEKGEAILKRSITERVPVYEFGEIIGPGYDFGETIEKHNISMKLLWGRSSETVVYRPWLDEYFTYTAKPGKKFVIVAFEFKNEGIREEGTPHITSGEILTDEGYIYSDWSMPDLPSEKEAYKERKATKEEINKRLTGVGWTHLMQGETTKGRIVFEIPEDAEPVEAKLKKLIRPIEF